MKQKLDGVAKWVRTAFAKRFGIDTRALAALRILAGLMILVDLLYRSFQLTAMYTDAGVFPRELVRARWPETYLLVHTWAGSTEFIAFLFIIQAIVAMALVVGFKTRIATILSFVLLLSLHYRNIYVLSAGDVLLRFLLFWGMFLPLGKRWSVDAWKHGGSRSHVTQIATVALLLQVVVIYFINAYHKIDGGRWKGGDALVYVFHVDRYMTPLGQMMNDWPSMVALLAQSWVIMLAVSPLLLLATGWWRVGLVAAYASVHAGMFAFMTIGFFPLISIIALVPFLPKELWDLAEHRVVEPLRRIRPIKRAGSWLASFKYLRPSRPANGGKPWYDFTCAHCMKTFVTAILLAWLIVSSAAAIDVVEWPEEIPSQITNRERSWRMFAIPATANTWLVATTQTESGTYVDVLHLDHEPWNQSRYISEPYPDFRWRKFLDAVHSSKRDVLRESFADYLCTRWNDNNDDKIPSVTIYRVRQSITLDGPDPPPEMKFVIHRPCR